MNKLSRLAAILLLVCAAGCANQASFQGENPYITGTVDELPAVDAARLCLETAQELLSSGLLPEAASQYERARRLDPTQDQVSRKLAVIYDQMELFSRARAEYMKALALYPDDAALMNDFGYFNYRRGNLEQAEDWLRRAVDQDPFLDRAWVNLGLVLGEQMRYRESLKAFQQVLPSADAHYNLGVILVQQGRYDEAREALNEALRLDANLTRAEEALIIIEDMQ